MTHYDTLGINRNANQDEIKQAWKRIAKKLHPDHNPGDDQAELKFKEAHAAFLVLSDPVKKQSYDNELNGNRSFTWRMNINFDPFSTFQTEFDEEQLRAGDDVEHSHTISFAESVYGCIKQVQVQSKEKIQCPTCNGERAKPGTAKFVCPACMGSGRKLYFNNNGRKCSNCHGFGDYPKTPCASCRGKGFIRKNRELSVRIPAGINDKDKLRIPGMGEPGNPPGDLYVTVTVIPHPEYKKIGSDLHRELYIPLDVAINGGSMMITSLDGSFHQINISQQNNHGQDVIVKGAGVPTISKSNRITAVIAGDLIIKLRIELPELKTKRAQKLFEELMEELKS